MKIIIADNSRIVRERLVALLQKINGNTIIIVGQAKNAVEMINSVEMLEPDVVIFDIHIPGNGYKALQVIKKNKPSLTIIIYTNYFEAQIKKKCYELGADYFFNKYSAFQKIRILIKQLSVNQLKSKSKHLNHGGN